MKFLTFACISTLIFASSALRVDKSHFQEQDGGSVNVEESKNSLKAQYKEVTGHVKQLFKQMDKNEDNIITRQEFDQFYPEEGVQGEGKDQIWAQIDANGDGEIPYSEYKAETKKKIKSMVSEEMNKLDQVDADGDGVITAKEIKANAPAVPQSQPQAQTTAEATTEATAEATTETTETTQTPAQE